MYIRTWLKYTTLPDNANPPPPPPRFLPPRNIVDVSYIWIYISSFHGISP